MGGQLVTAWLCNYFGGSPEQWGLTEETYKKKLEGALWLEEADPAYLECVFIEFSAHLREEGDKIDPLEYWTNRGNPGYMIGRLADAYNGHQTNLFS